MIYKHNLKTVPIPKDVRHIYCGRTTALYAGSALGNPFRIPSGISRDRVIEQYKRYAQRLITVDSDFRDEMYRIIELARSGDIHLYCYCKPMACHIDIIADLITAHI